MCGICGIFEPRRDQPFEIGRLRRMADSIRHRGPDAEGFHTEPGVGLAHRRLSIIDVEGGVQPLANENETVWIAFNGEIYNFAELNRQFLASGHEFRTRSDTETIVHLYEELGLECFAELRGMFALAIWDRPRRRLVLARDRIGKKPLFYAWDGRRLVFGSEIKALWGAGGLSDELDPEAMSDYFSLQYVPAPKTIYKHVRKLRPGHYLVLEPGMVAPREVAYWDIRFDEVENRSEEEWSEALLSEFRRAVQLRLVSDVPLGAFLSGGVDSSAVVALMNQLQPPVTTCSIGSPESSYDESAAAREFAGQISAHHHEHTVHPNAMELIPKLAWHYDEPFADSSAIPTYYVSQMARRHVTVALSGDGGDENFAGYRRYKMTLHEDKVRSYLPAGIRQAVFGPLGRYYPKLGWAPRVFRAKSTFQSLSDNLIDGYFRGVSVCPPEMKAQLLGGDVQRALGGYDSVDVLRGHFRNANTSDPLSQIQYVDMKTYLVDDILTKVDRASMANSLEVRCPLLDHKLMELAARMPSSIKLREGVGKHILKRAIRPIVPGDVLDRPKKGFSVPVAEWFRGELRERVEDAVVGQGDSLLNRAFLQKIWRQHQVGQRDWSALLWSVVMFRSWQQEAARASA